MHVHACVDAESEKPHGPRRHVGAGDRQPAWAHLDTTGGWWWGSSVAAVAANVAVEDCWRAGRVAVVKDVDCVEWPESSLPTPPSLLGDGGVRGPACREEELESTEPNLEMKNGENSVSQGPVCSSAQSKPWMAIRERVPTQATLAQCLSQRKEGVRDAVVGKSGGGVARRE